MAIEQEVARHYGGDGLLDRIFASLRAGGVDPDAMTADDLKPIDEFHIGGAQATRDLVGQLSISPASRLLDIGCGVGGTARLIARDTGAHVTGLDLTQDFVDAATELSARVGLSERTTFIQGSALETPFEPESFDVALMLHVGMNLPDKPRLMGEVERALRPGGVFAVYDVMRTGLGAVRFPTPWADTIATSFLASPEEYRAAAEAVGLALTAERRRQDFALDFFAELRARAAADARAHAPGPTIGVLMGETAGTRIANMIANIEAGRIAPVEQIYRAP